MAPRKGWFRTDRHTTGGPVLRQVRDLLDGRDLSGIAAVRAEIALDLADLVDGARIRQDPARFMQAVAKLESVLSRLPGEVEGVRHVDAADAGEGDGSDPLAEILGAGPEMGDAEDAG